jgi:poly-gamma-glutamate capsule biosynthesis protein CapA/YwtB (metallophosphatase superfamily)
VAGLAHWPLLFLLFACSERVVPDAAVVPSAALSPLAAANAVAPSAANSRLPSPRAEPSALPPRETVTVLLGGDVSFGRSVGQRLLQDPEFDPFFGLSKWFRIADLSVVNLESILSDQGGVTEHPLNPLVFSGPPAAARSLARVGIDAVSAANNHSWDYGRKGLVESLGYLKDARVQVLGASATKHEQFEITVFERGGIRIGLLAFTQVWNDGNLDEHPAKHFVAGTDYEAMKRALRKLETRADFVIVSMHASNEYITLPRERARRFAKALVISGADLVFGHHPHVVQGVEWFGQAPVLYSLGNLVFDSRQFAPDSRRGALSLVELRREDGRVKVERVEMCPLMLDDGVPAVADPSALADELVRLSKPLGGARTQTTPRGCVHVTPSDTPLPYSKRRGFLPNPEDPEDDG